MKVYNDIFFVIDTNNYNENKKDLFFGYKTVENEGFWLAVKHRLSKIHIYTSYISPVIIIYKKDDYWAISNSCYYLNEFLKEKGIILEINEKFLDLESKKKTSFSYEYYNDILLYKDLFINNNDEEIDIINGKLTLTKKDFKLFEKDINLNLDILNKWYEKYYNYLLNKDNVTLSLSGGLGSRFLWYNFLRQNNSCKLYCYNNKSNVTDYLDGKLAKELIKKYTDKNLLTVDKEPNRNVKTLDCINNLDMKELNQFILGISYNPMLLVKTEWLRVVGTGSNIFRYEFQDLNFLNGNIRRNWVASFIAKHYLINCDHITPYMDSLLLQLDTKEPDYLHVILYSLFAKSLLTDNIPFITKNKVGEYKFQEFRKELFERFSKITNF